MREMLARIDERQKNMSEKMELVYSEVKKTNGRVTALENWKSSLIGSWKTLVIISSVIGTALGWLVNHFL